MNDWTPISIANKLVPRFLAGELMLASEIAKEFSVTRDTASAAVRRSRDVLRDDYNIVLPIANYQGDWLLGITTSAADAFFGEIPQLRALRTRHRNMLCRMTAAMALVKTRPRLGTRLIKSMESGISHMDDLLDTVLEFMADETEGAQTAASMRKVI